MTVHDRPEVSLMLMCAHPVQTPERAAALRALIDHGIDWNLLLELAARESVVPQIYRSLLNCCRERVPTDVMLRVQRFYDANVRRNRMLAAELLMLRRAFQEHGIEILNYKGPEMAQNIYGDIGLRKFKDLDFLVRPEQVTQVLDVLEQHRYRRNLNLTPMQEAHFRREFKEYGCSRPNDLAPGRDTEFEPYWDDLLARNMETVRYYGPIVVEPHWAITTARYPLSIDYEELWGRAHEVALENGHVLALSPEDLVNVLCINGCKAHWKQLQLVCDIAAVIDRFSNLDWVTCCERARQWGSLRMLLLSCALVQDLFGNELPREVGALMPTDKSIVPLVRRIRAAICGERPGLKFLPKQFSLLFFHMRERPRDKLLYLLRTISTPRVNHFRLVSLPDRLFFLYYVIAPAYDYIVTPFWRLGRHLRPRTSRTIPHVHGH